MQYSSEERVEMKAAYDHGCKVALGASRTGSEKYKGDVLRMYFKGVEGLPSSL